jgi:SAM-dependent methyltransferase
MGIDGKMADLYDIFVDWQGRLGREMPGITKRLREAGAHSVLDVGCGTGRHVGALLEAGFDAHGADMSEDMLVQARTFVGDADRFHVWRVGDPSPAGLGPFDALVCLGNVWPQVVADEDVAAGAAAFHALLKPGGLLLVGLKAVAVRRESGNPYLPLLRREHEGRPLYFIRFADFTPGEDRCRFHMVVVAGEDETVLHRSSAMRVWAPAGLVDTFTAAGFADVRISARLDNPDVAPEWEDVFVHAKA